MALKFNPLVFGGFDMTGSGSGGEGPPGPKGEFNFTGAWTAKAARTKGDAVTRNGATWACVKTVTETEDREPGTEPAIWKEMAAKGATGAEGAKGTTGNTGPKGEFNYRGAWVTATPYAIGDAVTEGGTTYAAIKANESVKPPEGTNWKVIAEKGATGAEGPKGTTGEKGEKGEAGTPGAEGPAGQGVPVGGTTGQVLTKKSNTNFDDEWKTPSGGAPSGAAGGVLGGEYPNPSFAALNWVNVEAVNAKLTQTVTIQVALFAGHVLMRGLGKVETEIAVKGVLFTMPAAMRPATERLVTYGTTVPAANTSTLAIKTNGEVETRVLLAAAKTPSFDGLMYSL